MDNLDWSIFDKMDEKEIRRRQSLCEAQIKTAFTRQNTEALNRLRKVETELMNSMLRRC